MERYLLWWWLLYELNDACVVLLIAPSSFPKNFFVRSNCWCVSIIPIMTASSKWYTCTSVRKMVWASKGSFWRSSVASVISVGQKPLSGSFYPSFFMFSHELFFLQTLCTSAAIRVICLLVILLCGKLTGRVEKYITFLP